MKKSYFNHILADNWDDLINWSKREKSEKKFIFNILKKNFSTNVLDAACGTGFDTYLLKKQGIKNIISVDSSSSMIGKATENSKKYSFNGKFIKLDLKNLTSLKNKFDAIICLGNSFACILNDKERKLVIKAFNNVLKKNGIVIIDHRNYENNNDYNKKKYYYLGLNYKIMNKNFKKYHIVTYKKENKLSFNLKMIKIYQKYIIKAFIDKRFQLIQTYFDRKKKQTDNCNFILHVFKKLS